MSLEATTAAFQAKGLTPVQRLVLLIYADHCDEDGKCWPSQSRVAERAEVNRQTVNRATKELEKMGLVSLEHRSRDGGRGQTSNLVRIHVSRCLIKRQGVSQKETGGEPQEDRGVKHRKTGGEPQEDTNLPLKLPVEPPKEKKPPKSPKGDSFDPLGLDLPHGEAFREAWSEWVEHRKEIKKKLTPTSSKAQLRQLGSISSANAVAMIRYTISKGWQGLREPELPNGQKTPSRPSLRKLSNPEGY